MSPWLRAPVNDTTLQIKKRVTKDGPEWIAPGVSMTPPPACNSAATGPEETPPPSFLRSSRLAYPHPAGQLPTSDWLTDPSVTRSEIRVGGRGRRWRRRSGSGIRGRGGEGGCSGSVPGLGKFPLPVTDPEALGPIRLRAGARGSGPRFPPLGPAGPGNH